MDSLLQFNYYLDHTALALIVLFEGYVFYKLRYFAPLDRACYLILFMYVAVMILRVLQNNLKSALGVF
jgi:hypothetical protein